ncbi:hypothetical protein U9M48_014439 [Paspalum notatum var. saurae]|uniref:Uncharacterized protein n=1 Tax=Paspalum notatum var. saurae TaxID=547442 RepID=A0AAQ3WKV6_PASNO
MPKKLKFLVRGKRAGFLVVIFKEVHRHSVTRNFYCPFFWEGTFVDALMESKGGKKSSSSSSKSMYEAPLGYKIEDVRPAGGIKKFQSAAYSNCARKPS